MGPLKQTKHFFKHKSHPSPISFESKDTMVDNETSIFQYSSLKSCNFSYNTTSKAYPGILGKIVKKCSH